MFHPSTAHEAYLNSLVPILPALLPPFAQVGAPSLPNLLGALDPFTDTSSGAAGGDPPGRGLDPYKLLSSLAVGESYCGGVAVLVCV